MTIDEGDATKNLMESIGFSSIVTSALQSGLFQRMLLGPPEDAAGYARALSLHPQATGLVLDTLVAAGIATCEEGRFSMASDVAEAIARGPGGASMIFDLWRHAPAFLATGERFVKMDRAPGERESAYKGVVAGLGRMFESVARDLAAAVLERISPPPARILDVGCGSGVWSLAMAERLPGARVTGLDLPAVLAAFQERAGQLGLGDRVSTIPGDMHAASIPPGAFDLAVIANVLRLESPDHARSLVARVAGGLAKGGALLVVDALAGGRRDKEIGRTVYAFHLAMRTEGGRVHPPGEVREWLRAAGLSRIEAIDLEGPAAGHGALLAR
jgi:ubiquinone/menaquinone biosynthesis C-methylase UbiE